MATDRKQAEQDGSPTVHNQSHGAQPKHGNEPTTVKANQQESSGVQIGSVRKWISLSRVPMEILIFPIEPINKVCLYVLFIKRYLKNKLNLTLSRS